MVVPTLLRQSKPLALRHLGKRLPLPQQPITLPKFIFPDATHTVETLKEGDVVTLHGTLDTKPRILAKRSFAELRDTDGNMVQLLMQPGETDGKCFQLLEKSGPEDTVCVTGYVKSKVVKKDQDPAFEVVVSDFQTLNSGGAHAAWLDRVKHEKPDVIPPKFRYLQLRAPYYQNALRTRSKAAHLIRKILVDKYNFTEIDTPLLFKSTPEGAREFLVPTRAPNRFYALPQSPQQYKQILMSSGFSRYFQIAKCFRDEDLRSDRQPEFTQVDLEIAFINNSDHVTALIDDLVQSVWHEVGGMPMYKVNEDGYMETVDFENYDRSKPAFTKLPYIDALTKYGIDKPDLRCDLSFVDFQEYFIPGRNPDNFDVVEACILRGAFNPEKFFKLPQPFKDEAVFPNRVPWTVVIKKEDDAMNWFQSLIDRSLLKPTSKFSMRKFVDELRLEPGDIMAISTRAELPYENPTPLGKFRQLAIEHFPDKWNRPILKDGKLTTDYDRKSVFVGSWVVDFPLFSPREADKQNMEGFPTYKYYKLQSTHHPFTMAKIEDYSLLEKDPLSVHGEHYDLVINGVEVGGGSRRIHDAELQRYVFKSILGINNYEQLFGHLLNALEMGCPPHAGIALGFDRLCAMLIGSSTIRDVIAFPKNQSGTDPVVESPTDVPNSTLKEYYITKLDAEEKEGEKEDEED